MIIKLLSFCRLTVHQPKEKTPSNNHPPRSCDHRIHHVQHKPARVIWSEENTVQQLTTPVTLSKRRPFPLWTSSHYNMINTRDQNGNSIFLPYFPSRFPANCCPMCLHSSRILRTTITLGFRHKVPQSFPDSV